MELHESAEMYLETILVLKNRIGLVRSIDIVKEMDFSKPTISIAMKKFKEDGYITIDASGFIELTEKGRNVAEMIYERHNVLTQILLHLGVPQEHAEADACKMEHDISEETFKCLKKEYIRLRNRK